MATATTYSAGIAAQATGSFTGAGSAVDVDLGFVPTHVKLINVTDRITNEWVHGMAATVTLKTVAAGTATADTNSDIVITDNGFTTSPEAAISGKDYVWIASM